MCAFIALKRVGCGHAPLTAYRRTKTMLSRKRRVETEALTGRRALFCKEIKRIVKRAALSQ